VTKPIETLTQAPWGRRIAWAILVLACLLLLHKGFRGIWRINDFDVFHLPAIWAWERSAELYWQDTREGRHFLYPPTAAFLLMPLGWLSYPVSGTIFTLVRLAALGLILLTVVRWCQAERWAGTEARSPWILAGGVVICWRFIRSDFGNGQINLILLAVSLVGLRLGFVSRAGCQWAGGALAGIAAAVKVTPLLLLGVFLLHRRWRALAGAALCLVAVALLTTVWFGGDLSASLWEDWEERVALMTLESADRERVASLPELIATGATHAGVETDLTRLRRWWRVEVLLAAAISA
jgi:hypothetical protein